MSVVRGKALLVIRRLHEDGEEERYEVRPFIQSASEGEFTRYSAHEDFGLLEYGILPLPRAAYRLKPGDTLRVYVVYKFVYRQDYWGEHDVSLTYRKERVRRIQRYRERYTSRGNQ